jgi:hypothetical protein
MGSPAVAALIAHLAFWGLLVYGWTMGALTVIQVTIVLVLWLAGAAGLPYAPYEPMRDMLSSYVAVLDVALVFMIFKGDIRFTWA